MRHGHRSTSIRANAGWNRRAERPLRIGIVAPAWVPTPPPAYGGVECVLALLTRGLMDRGHEVVLVAAPGSDIAGAEVVTPLEELPAQIGDILHERQHALGAVEAVRDCDVVIDHSGITATAMLLGAGLPTLHVAHGAFDDLQRELYAELSRQAPGFRIIAISESQAASAPGLPFVAVCHNGLDVAEVPFRADHDGHLAFLGRMSPDKGVGEAIGIARSLGMPLRIAAKCREPQERAYFASEVEPHLGDDITYLGELGTDDKYALLAGARALVFPIAWEEPFGMVMLEAMAAGTPVLATARGAVPEVVRDGVTGFIRESSAELARCGELLEGIDPAACRGHVSARFSAAALARRYEVVATRLADEHRPVVGARRVLARIGATGLMS